MLAPHAPTAAATLADVETASSAVVTIAVERADLDDLPGSGFLVPPVEGRTIKAATFSFAKWDWVREAGADEDLLVMRCSIGRHREEEVLQRPDEEVVQLALEDRQRRHEHRLQQRVGERDERDEREGQVVVNPRFGGGGDFFD